jgi:hypothetical protein
VLGFAIGFLHLQSQGVPMKDVIRMARIQRRRIRLDWSARRWREEHERLARAETLKRLAEENVRYDLGAVAALLPTRFNGYLIRSSRRLGMEGLRQRHCVASYNLEIQAGYCVIASVFINHQRWTVQLARTGNDAAPLRLVQMRSRFNQQPQREQRQAICRELGIAPDAAAADPQRAPCAHAYLENLQRILPLLRTHQVRTVTVSFDGSGDSGSIDEVRYGDVQIDAKALRVEVLALQRVFDQGLDHQARARAEGSEHGHRGVDRRLPRGDGRRLVQQRRWFWRTDPRCGGGHGGTGDQCSLHHVLQRVFQHSGHCLGR